ncbi:hypothetical protein BH23PLA1_BH23PLA1_11530 [soil metagenome]
MLQHRKSIAWLLVFACIVVTSGPAQGDEEPDTSAPAALIDATTMRQKVLCGYQGWFRCPGDPAVEGWRHWSRDAKRIAPETLTFEMWPDLSESEEDEQYPAPGFTHPDGRPAHLFSSAHPRTVQRHFRWMAEHGLDGVFLQRFLVELRKPSLDQVLAHVRASAAKTGRVYALGYDLSGAREEDIEDLLIEDWKRLVDELRVTEDDRYLHHEGKPVLFVWGFFSDRFAPELAHRILDFFKEDERYGVWLIGGCQWYWRNENNEDWAKAFRRFDAISPWNVGHYMEIDGQRHAATHYWNDDRAEANRAGMEYLPVIYPGFGWTNLKGPEADRANAPRLGGEFFWRQFAKAAELEIDMAYVAMFDEVDEATAIFKVSNDPPTQAHFLTYEGLPEDWYLRLTAEGTKLIRGDRANQLALPITP